MEKRLRNRDIFGSLVRWVYFSHACYNYERMQGNSFAQSMAYSLKRLYPDEQKLGSELKKHTSFFNTEPNVGCVIHGIVLGMEEKRANGQDVSAEQISNIKTGLMGAIAGLGDPLTQGIIVPVLLALGMYFAVGGNIAGPISYFIAVNIVMWGIACFTWNAGYKQGTDAVMKLMEGNLQSRISRAAGILGCMMLGAMVSEFTGITFLDAAVSSAAILSRHLPVTLSLLATLLCYLLVKRGISTRLMVLGIFAVGFILSLLGLEV